jgi:outer membrane protein assembly factor BamB
VPAATQSRSEPGGPVVFGSRIFVGWSGTNGLLVLDRHDGSLVDTVPTRAPVATEVWVDAQHLVVCDSAGYTQVLKPEGRRWVQVWEHYSGAPILSRPTVTNGVVYVANVDDAVYALDLASGELKWRHQHKLDAARTAELELYGAPPPTLVGDAVYVGFSDGFLAALGATDGSPRWEAGVGEGAYPDLIAPALVTGNGVIVGGFSEPLVHLDPATRATAWRLEFGIARALVPWQDQVLAPGTDGKLREIDPRTGALTWEWDSGTSGVLGAAIPTPVGAFVTSSEGSLYLVDLATGALKWTFDPGVYVEGIAAPPALAGRDLYVLSNGGVLYDLRAALPDPVMAGEDWVSPKPR